MSSDTGKENASVVDSSLTEWKQDMGNSDDPESSTDKVKGHNRTMADEAAHCHGWEGSNRCNTRYFIIKSLNHHNIHLSVEKGIWATQVMNERVLDEAFNSSGKVILIFSVNMSGFFQGYAQMVSCVGWRRDNIWSQGRGKSVPWGRSFKVKWLQLNDLPFQKTLHLKNPLNDYKPVKISRDCQELSSDIGQALCKLLDGENDLDGPLKRHGFPFKGTGVEAQCSIGNEDFPPGHMSWSMPFLYPSILHQDQVNMFQSLHQRPATRTCPDLSSISSGASQLADSKHSQISGHGLDVLTNGDVASVSEVWGLSVKSPLASTLTEDDFLEMSYEEYLEVHRRYHNQLSFPATLQSGMPRESSSRKRRNDDRNTTERSVSYKKSNDSSSPLK